ncbi:PHB depolymerase family esterase [Leptospira sp. 96542]|nr:PHB depolymerase family esterase [Leptospira sp. 96542]
MSNEKTISLPIEGRTRTFLIHYPKKWKGEKIPLIIALHGRLGNGAYMINQTKLDVLSDEKNVIVVFPDGFRRSWADGRGSTPADEHKVNDVRFIESVAKYMIQEGSVDPSFIFLLGHSNGGFMAQRLALEKPELWRGVLSVSSQLSVFALKLKTPKTPVSVGILVGTADPIVPYSGGYVKDGGEILSAEDSFLRWKNWNGCEGEKKETVTTPEEGLRIETITYSGCNANTKIKLYKMIGVGHVWPGEKPMFKYWDKGIQLKTVQGSDFVWDFFSSL